MADLLSERIRTARLEAELTMEKMAPQLGVTLRTLSRWESGETQRISVAMVAAIARLTGKPLAYFVNGDEPAEDAA